MIDAKVEIDVTVYRPKYLLEIPAAQTLELQIQNLRRR
jgi:hypothetical protein